MIDYGNEYSENTDNYEVLEDGIVLEHFQINRASDEIFEESSELYGTPLEDTNVWEKSEVFFSDGLMCEKYIAEQLLGRSLNEKEICDVSSKQGIFEQNFGIAQSDIGSYLESIGLSVICDKNLEISDIKEALDNNEKVICAISNVVRFHPDFYDVSGIFADSAVEVIGIDERLAGKKSVIINDPNDEIGGTEIDCDLFIKTWSKSDSYAVFVNNRGNTN